MGNVIARSANGFQRSSQAFRFPTGSCLVQVGVSVLLLATALSDRASYINVTKEDYCDSHEHCWQCVQDACSRVQNGLLDDCFWCNSFAWGGEGCVPFEQLQFCLDSTHETKGCLASELNSVKNQVDPLIEAPYRFVHPNYTVEFPSGDVFASQKVRNRRYDVWINMDGRVENISVTETCGQFSPIEVTEQIDSTPILCWDIGEREDKPICNVTEEDDPGRGLTVHYGKTCCCSNKEAISGMCTEIDVTVTMVTDHSHGSQQSSAIQSFGNLSILTNCSEEDSIEFVIATSQLTDRRIDWRLDVSKTALHCEERSDDSDNWGQMLSCMVHPIPVIHDRNVSWSLCMDHFTVQLSYENSTQRVYNLSDFPTWNDDELYFLIPLLNLVRLEVNYSYPGSPSAPVTGGVPNPIIFSDSDSSKYGRWDEIIWITASALVAACVVSFTLIVYRIRKLNGHGDGSGGPRLGGSTEGETDILPGSGNGEDEDISPHSTPPPGQRTTSDREETEEQSNTEEVPGSRSTEGVYPASTSSPPQQRSKRRALLRRYQRQRPSRHKRFVRYGATDKSQPYAQRSGGSRISQTEGRTPGFGIVTSQRQLSILRNRPQAMFVHAQNLVALDSNEPRYNSRRGSARLCPPSLDPPLQRHSRNRGPASSSPAVDESDQTHLAVSSLAVSSLPAAPTSDSGETYKYYFKEYVSSASQTSSASDPSDVLVTAVRTPPTMPNTCH